MLAFTFIVTQNERSFGWTHGLILLARHPVPVLKQTFQLPLDEGSQQPVPKKSQRELIRDAVLKITGVRTIGFKNVGVLPSREGASNLCVNELPVFDVAAMLGDPADRERRPADRQFHPRAIANSAGVRK
jgi:hypothetical protein